MERMLSTADFLSKVSAVLSTRKSRVEIEFLEDYWRAWMEDTYASDLPESLYDTLWNNSRPIIPDGQKNDYDYAPMVSNYIRNVYLAQEAIEAAKDPNYKTSFMSFNINAWSRVKEKAKEIEEGRNA